MASFRKAAGLSQQDFGERMGGWSAASVSAAERSWDGSRIKKFDADEIMRIAAVLNLPLAALFVPPEDSGTAVHYVLDTPLPVENGSELGSLLPYAFPDFGEEYGSSPVWDAYRQRLIAAGLGRLDKTLDMALHILAEAQRVAGETIDSARRERDAGLSLTREDPKRLADAARNESARAAVDETLLRARDEADRILDLSRHRANQIIADAAARATSLDWDIQERQRQLEQQIDDLRAFERLYRSRLGTFLEGQLRNLWSHTDEEEVDAFIAALRERAAEGRGDPARAVLLYGDGTFDVLRSDQIAAAALEREERHKGEADEGQRLPAVLVPRSRDQTPPRREVPRPEEERPRARLVLQV